MKLENLFDALGGDDADALARLHRRLERDAEHADLLDVGYRTLDTPLGSLLLAALAEKVSPRILRAPARLDAAVREIDEYFTGSRTHFDLPLDLQLTDGFRREVIEHLSEIGYGHRESYAAVAAAIGHPLAVRAVGSACARNPLPLVIPCHRVVRADGSIGQYVGGADAKQTLLTLEAA